MEGNKKGSILKEQKFIWGLVSGAVVMLVVFGVIYGVQAMGGKSLSAERVKAIVVDYIQSQGAAGQAAPTIDSIESYNSGLYKLEISLSGQKATAYVTKDGTKIFPVVLEMNQGSQQQPAASQGGNQPAATVTNKSDKPKVELFVMSYCPYGTQIEKGIIPAVQALGNKVDFSLKFVNYAMHGKQEIDENARQYCIQKEQKDKLLPYMDCFLKSDDSASCIASSGISQKKLDSCVASADKQFKLAANFNDKSTWMGNYPPFDIDDADNQKYGVQGSPTLVINGTTISSARDSASLLSTICSAFNDAPEACASKLSNATPAPGFGEGTQAAGAPAADCATN